MGELKEVGEPKEMDELGDASGDGDLKGFGLMLDIVEGVRVEL